MTSVTALLRSRPSVTVQDLLADAELLARHDRKYVIHSGDVPAILHRLTSDVAVLVIEERLEFRYETVYFDTTDLRSFRDAARGRPERWKVRVRSYLDSSDAWFEVKLRHRRGQTVKHRLPRPFDAELRVGGTERRFLTEITRGVDPTALDPALRTTYRRITLLDRSTGSRATIDRGLECTTPDGSSVTFPGTAVVETKTTGRASAVDRTLWSLGHRPRRFSKYGTGLAAVRPELPRNRWHRTLGGTPGGAPGAPTDPGAPGMHGVFSVSGMHGVFSVPGAPGVRGAPVVPGLDPRPRSDLPLALSLAGPHEGP